MYGHRVRRFESLWFRTLEKGSKNAKGFSREGKGLIYSCKRGEKKLKLNLFTGCEQYHEH